MKERFQRKSLNCLQLEQRFFATIWWLHGFNWECLAWYHSIKSWPQNCTFGSQDIYLFMFHQSLYCQICIGLHCISCFIWRLSLKRPLLQRLFLCCIIGIKVWPRFSLAVVLWPDSSTELPTDNALGGIPLKTWHLFQAEMNASTPCCFLALLTLTKWHPHYYYIYIHIISHAQQSHNNRPTQRC